MIGIDDFSCSYFNGGNLGLNFITDLCKKETDGFFTKFFSNGCSLLNLFFDFVLKSIKNKRIYPELTC